MFFYNLIANIKVRTSVSSSSLMEAPCGKTAYKYAFLEVWRRPWSRLITDTLESIEESVAGGDVPRRFML